MKKWMERLTQGMSDAFERAGYDRGYGKVALSNRPDLCEYQCNGAMAGAKAYKKAPVQIAGDVWRNCRAVPFSQWRKRLALDLSI